MVIGMLLRSYFSLHHAQMAAYHARMAQRLELDGSEETAIALEAHVSAAVICAGAFLDATANEVAENDHRPRSRSKGAAVSLVRLNELLEDVNADLIDAADARWVDARTVIELRNRLVHYKHDWLDIGTENMVGENNLYNSPLQARLEASFSFLPITVHYIPRFLSPDCAAWAINSATAFLDEFFLRLGRTANHDHLRHRIEVDRP
ncbi:hypothetical protein [Xanthomonas cerealis]|uniref:hypothetical protein n=1 Tax=Xanthomonas cerealis TaxID=3390025 RepID=UPI000578EAE2|nr:hypothetical protein [Xanthomonas translucens]UKE46250.1 hypothetical protein KHA79_14100 [Xanthomonas translucens pv. cerealis]